MQKGGGVLRTVANLQVEPGDLLELLLFSRL